MLEVNADDTIDYLLVMVSCKKYSKIGLNLEFELNSKFESGSGTRIYQYYIYNLKWKKRSEITIFKNIYLNFPRVCNFVIQIVVVFKLKFRPKQISGILYLCSSLAVKYFQKKKILSETLEFSQKNFQILLNEESDNQNLLIGKK